MQTANHTVADPDTITVRVPIVFRRRGGRKAVITTDGSSGIARAGIRVDSALVKAVARAFRWRKLIEAGVHATVAEIATVEKVNASYVSRLLRLNLLAPATIEAILDGRQGPEATLATLVKPFPVEWGMQDAVIGKHGTPSDREAA